MQKTNQKEFRVKKVIKRKDDVKWKGYDSSFNSWIDKNNIVWMGEYFHNAKSSRGRVNIELDLSNYATKVD